MCRLPEKGRKEIEEIVEEMKEGDREERGTGMKVMATSPIMVNNMFVYYCSKMDIFSLTVFIVVSVYQQKLTPPVEI